MHTDADRVRSHGANPAVRGERRAGVALFPKDFRDDENHQGAEKAATEEEIQEGPTGRGRWG